MAEPTVDATDFQQFVSEQLAQACVRILEEYKRAHAPHDAPVDLARWAHKALEPCVSSTKVGFGLAKQSVGIVQAPAAQPTTAGADQGRGATRMQERAAGDSDPPGSETDEAGKSLPIARRKSPFRDAEPGNHRESAVCFEMGRADGLVERVETARTRSEGAESSVRLHMYKERSESSNHTIARMMTTQNFGDVSFKDQTSEPYVIHPEATWYRVWHHFVTLVALLGAVFSPVQYAFGDVSGRMVFFEYPIDGVTAVDILLAFNVAVQAPAGMVWKRGLICRHRVRTPQFWVDLFVVMPWSRMASLAGAGVAIVNALSLCRLLRVYRIVVMFRDLQKSSRTNLIVVVVAKFVVFIVLWTHTAGCILYALARENDFGPETWVFKADPDLPSMPGYTRYSHMLYWAVATFKAGPSHGDLTPSTDLEMIWSCVAMMFNICLQTYLVSSLAALLTRADVRIYAMRSSLSQLSQFAERYGLTTHLYGQVRAYTMFKFSVNQELEHNVLTALPEIYRQRISHALYDSLLKRVPVLLRCSPLFLKQLHGALESMWHMEGHDLVKEEDSSVELQIVVEGAAGIYYHTHEIETVSGGESITAVAFICQVAQQYGVRTKRLSRILSLSRSPWEAACNAYPEDVGRVKSNLVKICEVKLHHCEGGTPFYEAYTKMLNVVQNHLKQSRETQISSLCFAASVGDLDKMRRILKGHSANCADYDMRTPLHIAAAAGQLNALNLLIRQDADVNIMDNAGCTPLMEALRSRQDGAAQLLFSHGARLGLEDDAPRTLHSPPSSVALVSALASSSDFSVGHVTNRVQAKHAAGELCVAAADPHQIWFLSALLKYSADVNASDYDARTALHVASANGNQAAVKLLIKQPEIQIDVRDHFGRTPLMEAVRHGHEPCARLLKERGAFHGFCTNPETNEDTNSVHAGQELCQAAFANQITYLNGLVNLCGLDVDTPDYDLRTALMLSCCSGHVDTAVTLVQMRADIRKRDRWGHTAVSEARDHGYLVLADLLERLSMEKEREQGPSPPLGVA